LIATIIPYILPLKEQEFAHQFSLCKHRLNPPSPIRWSRRKFFVAALRSLNENAIEFGDAKISTSVLGVKSSLLSLNDGRVKDD
jgi:hypothetical protein